MRCKNWKMELLRSRTYYAKTKQIHYVIIGQSEFDNCDDKDTCIDKVLDMQKSDQIGNLWTVIGHKLLRLIFEGRSANFQWAMVGNYNHKNMKKLFLGDNVTNQTYSEKFYHLNKLLTDLVKESVFAMIYNLLGECQIIEEPRKYMEHSTETFVKCGVLENQPVDFIAQNMHG